MSCRIPPNGGFTEYFPLNRKENSYVQALEKKSNVHELQV